MKFNEGLTKAHNQLRKSFLDYENRTQARRDELEEKIKKDRIKKDEYFNDMYKHQNARVQKVREILKIEKWGN